MEQSPIKSAIIYTRFSPRPDASISESCTWQKAECEQFAVQKGFSIRRVFSDPDKSGADAIRPTLWEAISTLKKGEAMIVWKWDRLARDLILALQIERAVEQRGAYVLATTGDVPGRDPQAQFTRHILMAVSELERKMISQRTSASMKSFQRSGRRMSAKPPYGWIIDPSDEKRIIEDPNEQEVRHLILEMASSGLGYRLIAADLKNRGIVARCGRPFGTSSVKTIVRRG